MRMHVRSDLHLEQADFTPPPVHADVVARRLLGAAVEPPGCLRRRQHEFYGYAFRR
jgi:hypothetical protein